MGFQKHAPVHGTCAIIVPPLLEPHHESRVRHLQRLNMTSSPGTRLTAGNAAVLCVDHQTGLSNGVADQSLPEYKKNVLALTKLTRAFKLPTVITTSAADGPNGPFLPEARAILPDTPKPLKQQATQVVCRSSTTRTWREHVCHTLLSWPR